MHLIEAYALTSGCTIDRCFISEEIIELPTQPYITLHSYNPKGKTRQYKYWQDVIDSLIADPDFNYEIIQIGSKNDTRCSNINTSYLGKTNYNSLAFLIKNCSLHVGFDSLPVHIASHYDKKIVALYPHYSRNTGPYFSSPSNVILLQSDHSVTKPVFNENDHLEKINNIDPTLIVNGIKKLLK